MPRRLVPVDVACHPDRRVAHLLLQPVEIAPGGERESRTCASGGTAAFDRGRDVERRQPEVSPPVGDIDARPRFAVEKTRGSWSFRGTAWSASTERRARRDWMT